MDRPRTKKRVMIAYKNFLTCEYRRGECQTAIIGFEMTTTTGLFCFNDAVIYCRSNLCVSIGYIYLPYFFHLPNERTLFFELLGADCVTGSVTTGICDEWLRLP